MKLHRQGDSSWLNILSGIVSKSGSSYRPEVRLDDQCVRASIVSRTRWVLPADEFIKVLKQNIMDTEKAG